MPPASVMQLDNKSSRNETEDHTQSSNHSNNSASPTPSKSATIKKQAHSEKSKKIVKKPISLSGQHSINSLPACTSSTSNLLNLDNTTVATRQVFEALAKFQTCLFMLSNTVVRLHESLKLIIPFGPVVEGRKGEDTSLNLPCGMVRKVPLCPLIGKIDCNNAKNEVYNNGKPKSDTIVSLADNGACQNSDNKSSLTKSVEKISSRISKYYGIILALFASVCMSLVTLIVKYMEGYHPVSKVIWRLQGVLLPSSFIVIYVRYFQKKPLIANKNGRGEGRDSKEGDADSPSLWKWQILVLLVARGVVGCSADIFQYYSLKSLPLADSTVISFSTPIFVCIVAHFILGEKCGVVPIFTALLTLCGVIVICKPPILAGMDNMSHAVVLGNILAVLCMISNTFTTVIMRYLQHVHFAVTMLALGIFGTIEGFIVCMFTSPFEIPNEMNAADWTLAVLIAALFFFGQLAMTLALQHEEAGVVSLVRTCDVLFAFIWQVHFLHQTANVYSYIGAIIVTLGVIITALRRWIGDLPDGCPIRKRMFFILR